MHQTTLRFPEDLWRFLEVEARGLGVSVAQYVREAALARAAYDAGRRGEPLFVDPAILPAGSGVPVAPLPSVPAPVSNPRVLTESVIAAASETVTDSSAVWAQARVVRRRAEQLREEARAQHRRIAR